MVKQLQTNEFAKMILKGKQALVLDIRSENEFSNETIIGKGIQVVHIPFENITSEVDHFVDAIEKDENIIVVSTDGTNAVKFSEDLEAAGYGQVNQLIGGMQAWIEHIEPLKISDLSNGGRLYQFIRLNDGALSYMIESAGEAIVVDPFIQVDYYLDFIREHNLRIKFVIETQLHMDRISGGQNLSRICKAEYFLSKSDGEEAEFYFVPLEGERTLSFGNNKVSIQSLYTPGATAGSMSIIVDERFILTGNSLLIHSKPKCGFRNETEEEKSELACVLYDTIFRRFKNLSKEKIVLPSRINNATEINKNGKVYATIREVFQNIDRLNMQDQEKFVKRIIEEPQQTIEQNKAMAQINMKIYPYTEAELAEQKQLK